MGYSETVKIGKLITFRVNFSLFLLSFHFSNFSSLVFAYFVRHEFLFDAFSNVPTPVLYQVKKSYPLFDRPQ